MLAFQIKDKQTDPASIALACQSWPATMGWVE
jgi:hypothetical protein